MTEVDKNPIPELHPFHLIEKIGQAAHYLFDQYHEEPPSHGDHFKVDDMLLTEDVSGAGDGTWAE